MTRRRSITVTSLDYSAKVWDNKACQLRSEKCSGGKLTKVRITCMAAANAFGNEIPMFVIGKVPKPRCFKNAKFLPCRYRHKKTGWMGYCLRSGCEKKIENFHQKKELLH